MKKFKTFTMLLILPLFAAGCGNYQMFDTTYTYDYAIIRLQNGEVIEGKVEKWTDYEGEQLQVTIDGVTYLTNSLNCTLIAK